jgi:hypothetical protein
MKTAIEIPDALFREAKATVAERRQTLREFENDGRQEKRACGQRARAGKPEWMQGFDRLRRSRNETARMQGRIDAEFDVP